MLNSRDARINILTQSWDFGKSPLCPQCGHLSILLSPSLGEKIHLYHFGLNLWPHFVHTYLSFEMTNEKMMNIEATIRIGSQNGTSNHLLNRWPLQDDRMIAVPINTVINDAFFIGIYLQSYSINAHDFTFSFLYWIVQDPVTRGFLQAFSFPSEKWRVFKLHFIRL